MTRKAKMNVEKAIRMLVHVKEIKGNGEDIEAGLNLVLMYVSNALDELEKKQPITSKKNNN